MSALVGVTLLIIFAINPILKGLLAKQVEIRLVGNFHYTYEKLTVDILSRSVTFEGVKWRFPKDTTIFEQVGQLKKFRVSGISLMGLFGDQDLKIGKILFENPELQMAIRQQEQEGEEEAQKEPYNFYELIEGRLNSLEVDEIEVVQGHASWILPDNKQVKRKIREADVTITGLKLDSAIAAANNGWFRLRNVLLDCNGGDLFMSDSLHKLRSGRILLDHRKGTLTIDSFAVVPLFTRNEMRQVHPYEVDWINMQVQRIEMKGIDVEKFMIEEKLRMRHLLIEGFDLVAFRDKTPEFPPNHYPPLPQLALKNASMNVLIDSVKLKRANVRYEQLSENRQVAGEVFFTDMDADIYNITNDSTQYLKAPKMEMKVNTRLMGTSQLKVHFGFDLTAKNGDHWFKGTLEKFDLKTLNGVFEPLTAVRVKSGQLDHMKFHARLNNDVADGEMTFLYSRLKLEKLDDDLSKGGLENTIVSFIANNLLTYSSNPAGEQPPRKGTIHYERDKHKSVFNFWWKAMFSGMKSTVVRVQ